MSGKSGRPSWSIALHGKCQGDSLGFNQGLGDLFLWLSWTVSMLCDTVCWNTAHRVI